MWTDKPFLSQQSFVAGWRALSLTINRRALLYIVRVYEEVIKSAYCKYLDKNQKTTGCGLGYRHLKTVYYSTVFPCLPSC